MNERMSEYINFLLFSPLRKSFSFFKAQASLAPTKGYSYYTLLESSSFFIVLYLFMRYLPLVSLVCELLEGRTESHLCISNI